MTSYPVQNPNTYHPNVWGKKNPVQLFTDEKIITLYKLNLTFNIFSNPTPRLKVEDVKQELIQLLQTVQDDETVIHQLATLVKKVQSPSIVPWLAKNNDIKKTAVLVVTYSLLYHYYTLRSLMILKKDEWFLKE